MTINNLSKALRKNSTPEEQKLWQYLRNRNFKGFKFRRQVVIDKYIVDFLCPDKMLIIEIDGGQHNTDNEILKDKIRTKHLENLGYKVVRFWNNEINNNFDAVMNRLFELV